MLVVWRKLAHNWTVNTDVKDGVGEGAKAAKNGKVR